MAAAAASPSICFVVCRSGPARHLGQFARHLAQKVSSVTVYAAGPAQETLAELMVGFVPFSAQQSDFEHVITLCSQAAVVITDTSHVFSKGIQQRLSEYFPKVARFAYYEQLESHFALPEPERTTARDIMMLAKKTLFANADLAHEYDWGIGIGYSPVPEQAERLVQLRKETDRAAFFEQHKIQEFGQKVIVCFGGYSEEYFKRAFPDVLEASWRLDKTKHVIIFQKHPRAKEEVEYSNLALSQWSHHKILTIADKVIYNHPSAQLAYIAYAAGIPVIQADLEPREDSLSELALCPSATNADQLVKAINSLQLAPRERQKKELFKALGERTDWQNRIEKALTAKHLQQ